jgi:hypothetical protein
MEAQLKKMTKVENGKAEVATVEPLFYTFQGTK